MSNQLDIPSGPSDQPMPGELSDSTNTAAQLMGSGSSDRKLSTKAMLMIGFLVFAVVLFIGALVATRGPQIDLIPGDDPGDDPRLTPSPTPLATPTLGVQIFGKPSKYANDPQILELQAAIQTMKAQMDTDELLYPELDPPVLIVGITFDE